MDGFGTGVGMELLGKILVFFFVKVFFILETLHHLF
jgi:hypothetical protein